jgi:putative flavoprotein involved in K+ transport
VVGLGNSGAEIATDLAEGGAAFVAVSVRTPPPVVPRDPFGMPVQRTSLMMSVLPPRVADLFARAVARVTLGDLKRYGLPPQGWSPYSAGRVPVIDVGFTAALKRGAISVRPGVVSLTEAGARYGGGQTEEFDTIIAATGFCSPLPDLLEAPGALDAQGEPVAASGAPTSYPGLYFIGNSHTLRGHLLEASFASRRLAREVERYLS